MKKLLICALLAAAIAKAADPGIMVLVASWVNPPGGVSPTGFVMQKGTVSGGVTNWLTTQTAGAGATNLVMILPFTALEIDWRLAATNFYGTSEWAYARSPVPILGVGEVPKAVLNFNVTRR